MGKLRQILGIALISALLGVSFASSARGSDQGLSIDAPGGRVAAITSKLNVFTGVKPRVLVTPDLSANACVLPDKTIVITSGLISLCKSDDELAFVIAHEISHIIARDHYGQSTPAFNGSRYSDNQSREIEADRKAAIYSKKAGYNPDESLRLLARITPASNVYLNGRLEALANYLKTLRY